MAKRKRAAADTVEGRLARRTKMRHPASGTKEEFSDEELLENLVASLTDALDAAKRICDKSSGVSPFRHTRALIASVSNAISEDPVDKQLDLKGHVQSIDSTMKDLLHSCQSNWKGGWEEQGEYMNEICQEIAEWLRDIWNVLETGEDLHHVRECIAYCAETAEEILNTDSRAGLDHHQIDVSITNEADEVIYEASEHIGDTLTWFYKELLVMDAARGNGRLRATILADLKRFEKVENVFGLLQEPDEHWTPEMHAAAEELIQEEQNVPRGE